MFFGSSYVVVVQLYHLVDEIYCDSSFSMVFGDKTFLFIF